MAEDTRSLKRRHLIFYLEVFDDATGELIGHLVDITTKGVKVVSKEAIPSGRTLTLRMALPEGFAEATTLRFQATSRWSSNDVNPDFYDTGFLVDELDVKAVDVVHDLIQSLGFSDNE